MLGIGEVMNGNLPKCPVCLGTYVDRNDTAKNYTKMSGHGHLIHCETCGVFGVHLHITPSLDADSNLSDRCRAVISHKIRVGMSASEEDYINVSNDDFKRIINDGCAGPTPAMQATNVIKLIGDHVSKTGELAMLVEESLFAIIGAPSPDFAIALIRELENQGLVTGKMDIGVNPCLYYLDANLTLAGWQRYEAEKKGEISGNYGFIAMKFAKENEEDVSVAALDKLVKDVIKPAIKKHLPYQLQDLRDTARAGIIDNIMRSEIRDAAFVIVDLTHDNSGAYWEAGYAEGLGKPVIYICKKEKFEDTNTHFDTNHCTTVMWSDDNHDVFIDQLIATLRRSLNLF